MDQLLFDRAEKAYTDYLAGNTIVPELLFAWVLAEVHFAGLVTEVQTTILGGLPSNSNETTLLFETGSAYRGFRQAVARTEKGKIP